MREKKLLSVACVLAILAFGGCSWPGPPPPPPPYLAPVHTIAVQVQDASGQDPIDAEAMSRAIVSNLNGTWNGVHAEANRSSTRSDARLDIVIVRKTFLCGAPSAQNREQCKFHVTTSSTLTASDGKVLWAKSDHTWNFTLNLKSTESSNPWKQNWVTQLTASYLASDLLANSHPGT